MLAAALPGVAVAQQPSEGEQLAAFKACAAVADEAERHRCLDEALRNTDVLEQRAQADPQVPETPEAPGIAPASPPQQAQDRADFGRSQAAIDRERAQANPSPEKERQPLQTTVSAARLLGNQTLLVATADAGNWTSTERQRFRRTPEPGDSFEIVPGALGGFRCRLERTTLYACRRMD